MTRRAKPCDSMSAVWTSHKNRRLLWGQPHFRRYFHGCIQFHSSGAGSVAARQRSRSVCTCLRASTGRSTLRGQHGAHVFVRRGALRTLDAHLPPDEPIRPDVVRNTVRQAYLRCGLPYTRVHILRHTLARRLLETGGTLKEVADMLRHRALDTSMIYAKVDTRRLAAVAMPWPGSAA